MKSFNAKPWLLPQPVLIIGTYDENGVPNAMNAAWAGQANMNVITISMGNHKTTSNLNANGEFTLAFASKETMIILSKDDTVMSYLKNVDDSYYIDLYKEMVGEESSVDDIKKNIDDIVNLIQSQQNVLEFLSENKNMWNVQNGKIQFDDDILLNQYNQLLLAVQ